MSAKQGTDGTQVKNMFLVSNPTVDDDINKLLNTRGLEKRACECMVVSIAALQLLVIRVTFSNL
jgi:hypothetical protein